MATPQEEAKIIGWRPHLIRAAVIDLLHVLFGSAAKIRDPNLKHLVWTADPTTSRLVITTTAKFDLQNSGLTEGVAVNVGDSKIQDILLGEGLLRKQDSLETRVFWVVTPVTVACRSNIEVVTLMLSAEIALRLREISRAILRDYNFSKFLIQGPTGAQAIKPEEWVSNVQLSVVAQMGSEMDVCDLPADIGSDWN